MPKFLVDADGSLGARNGVSCGSIEQKMGIHGNATCVMNYDGATGWLVGEENAGLNAMFVMMNEARLGVGIQGLAQSRGRLPERRRLCEGAPAGPRADRPEVPDKPADPIIVHPDVRRTLLSIKAFNEAARALVLWTALQARHRPPLAATRPSAQAADDHLGLMTPVVKGVSPTSASTTRSRRSRCSAATATSPNGAWSSSSAMPASP